VEQVHKNLPAEPEHLLTESLQTSACGTKVWILNIYLTGSDDKACKDQLTNMSFSVTSWPTLIKSGKTTEGLSLTKHHFPHSYV